MITSAGNLIASSPNRADQTDQNLFNADLLTDLETLRREGNGRRSSFYLDARQSPASTTVTLTASQGSNQFVGLISSASPGALSNVLLPLSADMTAMDSFFFQDESINAASGPYNITIKTQGSAKIYGAGLAGAGVTQVQITDDGGYKELLYVTTDKWYLIRKSA